MSDFISWDFVSVRPSRSLADLQARVQQLELENATQATALVSLDLRLDAEELATTDIYEVLGVVQGDIHALEAVLLAQAAQILALQTQFAITDVSGTPGNASVSTLAGIAAWAGNSTQCTISNPAFTAARHVSIVAVEPSGALATVRIAQIPPVAGSFTANRSGGSPADQKFTFAVLQSMVP